MVENAGVETAGAITHGKLSEEKSIRYQVVEAQTNRSRTSCEQCSWRVIHIKCVRTVGLSSWAVHEFKQKVRTSSSTKRLACERC